MFLAPLLIILFVIFWIVNSYNGFIFIKKRIEAAIHEIGNQLKRQADLIPNLLESVKGYMKHEQEIFEKITQARQLLIKSTGSGNAQSMIEASSKLDQSLAPIRAVFESTPELQAAGPTGKLMDELRDTADKIMYSRRTLIDLTADYNTKIMSVPSNFIARIFGFQEEKALTLPEMDEATTVSSADLKNPVVKL